MRFQVVTPFKVKTADGVRELKVGNILILSDEMAVELIREGKVTPLPTPYLDADGDPVIPLRSDPKYRWWRKGGQSLEETVKELQELKKTGKMLH